MNEVRMQDNTNGLIFFQTPLARVRVEDCTSGHYGTFDGYNLVDVTDGFVWLTFGTDNCDDYYPMFCFNYQHKGEYVLNKFEE